MAKMAYLPEFKLCGGVLGPDLLVKRGVNIPVRFTLVGLGVGIKSGGTFW